MGGPDYESYAGSRDQARMVKELVARGYEGDALRAEVMRLTGLPAPDAQLLINVELKGLGRHGPAARPRPISRTSCDAAEVCRRAYLMILMRRLLRPAGAGLRERQSAESCSAPAPTSLRASALAD